MRRVVTAEKINPKDMLKYYMQ